MRLPTRGPAVLLVAVLLATVLLLGACSSDGGHDSGPGPTTTRTIVQTETAPAPAVTFTPAPATTVAPLPGSGTRAGEVERSCPYIRAGLDSEPTNGPNVADLEGDRVGRVTVLTGYRPVGCRFYFSYSYGNTRHEAVADILPQTFPSALDAHNALVLTARAGTEPLSEPNVVPGVDGIAYRTTFFGPDGARDWAFAFAKGRVLVVVHTQQSNTSRNAVNLGTALVSKF